MAAPTLAVPKTRRRAARTDNNPIPEGDPPPDETDPARITQPISAHVHDALKNAWRINRALPMCFIFDSVSPARQFKRGMLFSDVDFTHQYPRYPKKDSSDVDDITETDGDPPWMPYWPRAYTYVPSAINLAY